MTVHHGDAEDTEGWAVAVLRALRVSAVSSLQASLPAGLQGSFASRSEARNDSVGPGGRPQAAFLAW
jgi:hypothetical protein